MNENDDNDDDDDEDDDEGTLVIDVLFDTFRFASAWISCLMSSSSSSSALDILCGLLEKSRVFTSPSFWFYNQGSAFTPDYGLINHRKSGDAVINQINNQKASG